MQDEIIARTTSGSVCVNDFIVQLSVETLPFGGVGASGFGAYHGKYTFDTFSHRKSVLKRDFGFVGEYLGLFRYPPYTDGALRCVTIGSHLVSIVTSVLFLLIAQEHEVVDEESRHAKSRLDETAVSYGFRRGRVRGGEGCIARRRS